MHGYWLKEYGIAGRLCSRLPFGRRISARCVRDPAAAWASPGANVTVPHKEAAFALSATLDEDARATGAVNTLVFEGDGSIHGRNTDVRGFAASLAEAWGRMRREAAPSSVLGAGGAARAVVAGARARAARREIRLVNRTRARAEALAAGADRTVNITHHRLGRLATPRSQGPVCSSIRPALAWPGKPPLDLPLDALPKDAAVADIVYNPLETGLLRRRKRDAGHDHGWAWDADASGGPGFRRVVRRDARGDARPCATLWSRRWPVPVERAATFRPRAHRLYRHGQKRNGKLFAAPGHPGLRRRCAPSMRSTRRAARRWHPIAAPSQVPCRTGRVDRAAAWRQSCAGDAAAFRRLEDIVHPLVAGLRDELFSMTAAAARRRPRRARHSASVRDRRRFDASTRSSSSRRRRRFSAPRVLAPGHDSKKSSKRSMRAKSRMRKSGESRFRG